MYADARCLCFAKWLPIATVVLLHLALNIRAQRTLLLIPTGVEIPAHSHQIRDYSFLSTL